MELDLVRKELNMYDDAIKNLIALRMSLIPIVADIKIKNNLPLFQGKREEEIYNKIEVFSNKNGVNPNLVKDIYKLIISDALRIEEDIAQNQKKSIINKEIDESKCEGLRKSFEKLDNILNQDLPDIISEIVNFSDTNDLNLTKKSTLYYNKKINEKEKI